MGTKEEEKVNRADNLIPHNSDIFEDDNRAKRWETIYIAGMPIRKEDAHVRLTSEAYALLTEKAKAYNVSQKEIASEAILMLVRRGDDKKEYLAILDRAERLDRNFFFYVLLTAFVSGIAGVIIRGVL